MGINKQSLQSRLNASQTNVQHPLNSPLKSKELDKNKDAIQKSTQQSENAKHTAFNAKASSEQANQQKKSNNDKEALLKMQGNKEATIQKDQNEKSANNKVFSAATLKALIMLAKILHEVKLSWVKIANKAGKSSKKSSSKYAKLQKYIDDYNKHKVGSKLELNSMLRLPIEMLLLMLNELNRRIIICDCLRQLTPQKINQLVANMAPLTIDGKVYTKDSPEVDLVADLLENLTPKQLDELESRVNNCPLDQCADSLVVDFLCGKDAPPACKGILVCLLKQCTGLVLNHDQKQAAGLKSTVEQQAQLRIQPEETSSFTMKP